MTITRGRVPYDDLRGYLQLLEERGMLKRITAEVDPDAELGAICYRDLVKDGPGLLFENIKGYPDMPLAANVMYREDQLAAALNGDPNWEALRDMPWNDIQNVARHVKALSNHLIRKYLQERAKR